jgi:hypothetical protein
MVDDVCGLPQVPDVGAWLDRLSKLFDRAETLLILLLIIVLILVGGLVMANILGARRRG